MGTFKCPLHRGSMRETQTVETWEAEKLRIVMSLNVAMGRTQGDPAPKHKTNKGQIQKLYIGIYANIINIYNKYILCWYKYIKI